jgi:hypothetical protein
MAPESGITISRMNVRTPRYHPRRVTSGSHSHAQTIQATKVITE